MVTMIAITLISLFVALFFVAPSGDAKDDTRLMHSQGGWIQIAVAALGAFAQSRDNRRQQRDQAGMTREQIQQQAEEGRRSTAFEGALADYYQQQGNERARRSLANFSRFSTAPQGGDPYYSPVVPTMPKPEDFNATGGRKP